jgi:hypothetical protein
VLNEVPQTVTPASLIRKPVLNYYYVIYGVCAFVVLPAAGWCEVIRLVRTSGCGHDVATLPARLSA